MRLFVGIPLADSVQAELVRLVERLRPAAALRWSAPESWHITLQFLGNAREQQYQCLEERLAGIRCAPFAIRIGGVGVFERTGIVYAEVEADAALAALQRQVTAATALCRFEAELRPYRPHITLARGKGPELGRELRELPARVPPMLKFSRFTAEEFLLYESHLSQAGSTYVIRQRFRLETG